MRKYSKKVKDKLKAAVELINKNEPDNTTNRPRVKGVNKRS